MFSPDSSGLSGNSSSRNLKTTSESKSPTYNLLPVFFFMRFSRGRSYRYALFLGEIVIERMVGNRSFSYQLKVVAWMKSGSGRYYYSTAPNKHRVNAGFYNITIINTSLSAFHIHKLLSTSTQFELSMFLCVF